MSNLSWKGKTIALFTVIVLIAVFAFNVQDRAKVEAAAVTNGVATNDEIPGENGVKGTADNPFVILEIVPYEGYAEIGYEIAGCEPVDIDNPNLRNDEPSMGLINSTYLCNVSKNTYVNYDYFLKKTLKLSDSEITDYHIVVKTVQPDELNNHLEWINRADLISISPRSHIGNLSTVWNKYNKVGKSANPQHATDFGGNDLSWDAALRIFKKVVVAKDRAAIIIDWTVYTSPPASSSQSVMPCQIDYNGNMTTNHLGSEAGNSNNVYKLALMLRTMDPVVFYNLFLNDNGGTKIPLVQNGLYLAQNTNNEQYYWSQTTFMPTRKDGTLAWSDYWNSLWNTMKLNYNMQDNVSVSSKVYTYNGDCSLTQNLVNSNISYSERTKDFTDYAKTNGMDTSPASAIDYILVDNPSDYVKKNLSILDIEPSNEFTMTDYKIRMMIPYYTGTINIVPMTSSEFIGKIDDLNSKYDMIYLGLNDGGLNTKYQYFPSINQNLTLPYYNSDLYYDSKWVLNPTDSILSLSGLDQSSYTRLNDNLNGKIYLHVGPRVVANLGNQSIANLSNTLNVDWIKDIDGKSVATNGMIRLPGNDITALKAAELNSYLAAGYPILTDTQLYNTGTALTKLMVDQSSNIYRFVDSAKNGANKDNLIDINSSDADSQINNLIMKQKLQLNVLQAPTKYVGTDSNVTGSIDTSNYINGSNLTYRKLNFKYSIAGDDTKKYNVYLYIDANADGKYALNEINMSQMGVTANETHTLIKPLSSDYFGVIPWKLAIEEDGNSNIRSEQTGYSAVKRAEAQKQKIRILQIINPTTATLNLQRNIEEQKLFYTYTNNLNDYELTFTTESIAEFENLYKSNPFDCTSSDTEKATDQLVKNYDMLIFGFGDSYGDISNDYGALDNVKYFIDQYKSVLFTHDTTSPYNFSASPNPTGYHFNLSFRGIFGMDRFGTRQYNDCDSYADPNRYQYMDQATSPDGSLYKEIQGYTYYTAAKKANDNQNLGFKNILSGASGSRDTVFETNVATKLNDGQITQYPYKIDQNITIANTHSQWNQLNLNDPDIVVWYCLGEDKDDNYSTYHNNGKAIYEVSPNDASNNYYIYNKGNITYSGVGHRADANDLKPMETKLFVNTIIASYKTALKEPAVEVVDGQGGNNNYVMYINTDVNDSGTQSYKDGDMMDIRFIPWDYNFLSQYMGVTAKLSDGTPLVIKNTNGTDVNDVYTSKTGTSMAQCNNGTTYMLQYNKGNYNDNNKRTIIFTIENEKGLQCTCTLKLFNLTYFNLD